MALGVSRRGFLQLAGFSAGMVALSRLRALPPALAADIVGDSKGLSVLTPSDARILGAVAERMTFTGDDAMPRFSATGGLRTIDVALRQLPADVPQQLSWGLWMFEYAPPLFIGKPARFTGLGEGWQDVYLADWAESSLQTRRMVFQALKNLSMLGYYSQDATWKGITYSGPWVVRPRRAVPE
jgi:hypothetical protein